MAIDVAHVTAVLMINSGWHKCRPGSFQTVDFEFEDSSAWSGKSQSIKGFSFVERDGNHIAGPMSGILAVKH